MKLLENYQGKLEKIVVDAGYESEENYVYIAENKLTPYIKPSNYEKSKTRKYKKEQEFRESLKYDKKKTNTYHKMAKNS
ncbi:transposase [Peptoniphilus timonensis]|uniref:transposase n=1 Tax=Peptoniphilus timonensis TaxID=1268254 RepID=UPI0002EA3646|nr:transposase [Peptoniphilus timonensis]